MTTTVKQRGRWICFKQNFQKQQLKGYRSLNGRLFLTMKHGDELSHETIRLDAADALALAQWIQDQFKEAARV